MQMLIDLSFILACVSVSLLALAGAAYFGIPVMQYIREMHLRWLRGKEDE